MFGPYVREGTYSGTGMAEVLFGQVPEPSLVAVASEGKGS